MKDDYIVYTGNAYPHKNIDRLIDAAFILKLKLKIISGRNVFAKRLESYVKFKKAEDIVEILGFTPDNELKKIYKKSIAFVFPTFAEGFGLPPKEAVEAGTIAIVSNIPVLKEVYEDSVFYFDPKDVKSIVNAICKVLNMTPKDREKKITYAQNFMKRYSWSKMAKETLKIYESACLVQ